VLPTFQGQHETSKLSFAGGGCNLPANNYIITVFARIYRLFTNWVHALDFTSPIHLSSMRTKYLDTSIYISRVIAGSWKIFNSAFVNILSKLLHDWKIVSLSPHGCSSPKLLYWNRISFVFWFKWRFDLRLHFPDFHETQVKLHFLFMDVLLKQQRVNIKMKLFLCPSIALWRCTGKWRKASRILLFTFDGGESTSYSGRFTSEKYT
jgi:hypothetical protein